MNAPMARRALLMEYPAATSHERYHVSVPVGTWAPRCLLGWAPIRSSNLTTIQIVGPVGWLRSGQADPLREQLRAEGVAVDVHPNAPVAE